jgi:hypothetical protein
MVKNNLVIDPGSSTLVGSKAFLDADFSLDQSHNLFFTTIEDADFMDAEHG